LLDSVTQQVRTGVADDFQTVFVFGGDDSQRSVIFNQIGRINQLTVYTTGNGRFRKTGPMSRATSIGLTAWS
jgi:hypothetical protein